MTSIICFIILIVIDVTNYLLKKKFPKYPIHLPGQLLVVRLSVWTCVLYNFITQVILSTSISYGAKLNEKYNLQIINDVGGIPPGKWYVISSLFNVNEICLSYSFKPTLPVISIIPKVFTDAFVIGIVSFVINIAQAKLMAKKKGYLIHSDQVSILSSLSLSFL